MELTAFIFVSLCMLYFLHQFRLAGMHKIAIAYTVSACIYLPTIAFDTPHPYKFVALIVAMVFLIIGGIAMRKQQESKRMTDDDIQTIDNPLPKDEMIATAIKDLQRGGEYPYDERAPIDNAHKIALGILHDLSDRRGVAQELDGMDDDIRIEIVDGLAKIIRHGAIQSEVEHHYDGRHPIDDAHKLALSVLGELCDHGGIRQELENFDADVKIEIVEIIAEIIRQGSTEQLQNAQ